MSVLAAVVVAGCAGSPADETTRHTADQGRSHERPLSDALLPRSALPPGLQYRQIDEFPDLSQAFVNTTVRPPECGSSDVLHPYGDPGRLDVAVYVGSGQGVTLTVGLVRGRDDLDLSRPRRTLRQCSNVTFETPHASIVAHLKEVPPPAVDADDVFAYRQRLSNPEAAGRAQDTLFLAAVDGGIVVTVTGSAANGDMASYSDLLRQSLQRKRQVLG